MNKFKTTIMERTQLPPELAQQLRRASNPQARRAQKIGESIAGIIVFLIGVVILAGVGFLAYKSVSVWVILGGAILAAAIMAAGGLIADKETVLPVLNTIFDLVKRGKDIKDGK